MEGKCKVLSNKKVSGRIGELTLRSGFTVRDLTVFVVDISPEPGTIECKDFCFKVVQGQTEFPSFVLALRPANRIFGTLETWSFQTS